MGISNISGEIIPIIELGVLLENRPVRHGDDTRILIILSKGLKLGLLISQIGRIEVISESGINPVPEQFITKDRPYLFGSYQLPDGQILTLLDHEWLINENDFASSFDSNGSNISINGGPTSASSKEDNTQLCHYDADTGRRYKHFGHF